MKERQTTESAKHSIERFVNPQTLPEAGFQSYEKLKNNASEQKESFLSGEIRNPDLTYPHLHDLGDMDQGILRLYEAVENVRRFESDETKADIITTSLEFRMAEIEYIKLLGRLDYVTHEGGTSEEVQELTEGARSLGEQLYGVPDEAIKNAALGAIWDQLDAKDLSPSAKRLYDELEGGFIWGDKSVALLPRPENTEHRLPEFGHPSLAWAGEIVLEENADLEGLFQAWWAEKRAEYGDDYVAAPEDITEAYQLAFQYMDPENESGVSVVLDPEASALSWESPMMAIKVGGKRSPITSPEALFQKFLHEGKGHGGRAIAGLKSELPVLGTGLYTDTKRADYLTFEEGFCTTIEETVSNKTGKWNGVNLGHYINIALAEDGGDFRDVYEKAWRYRLLTKLQDGQEVTDDMMQKEQSSAYSAVVRIFRGTPTAHPQEKPLTFNKDLAYLQGRVLAMNHIKDLYDRNDRDGLMRLFSAKYDPTIPEQAAIVERYGTPRS